MIPKMLSLLLLIMSIAGFLYLPDNSLIAQTTTVPDREEVNTEKENSANISDTILESTPEIEWTISFGKIFWSIIIFLIAFITIRYASRLLETIGERWSNLRLLIKGLVPVIRIGAWTFVIYFIIAAIISPPIETLIAVTASAGIAVGFASQDILKNIIA